MGTNSVPVKYKIKLSSYEPTTKDKVQDFVCDEQRDLTGTIFLVFIVFFQVLSVWFINGQNVFCHFFKVFENPILRIIAFKTIDMLK